MKTGFTASAILLLTGLTVGLFLSEVTVRSLGLAPELAIVEISMKHGNFIWVDNAKLKYIPKPNSHEINSLGFRDREIERLKPIGSKRIVIIGDSVAYGLCNEHNISLGNRFSDKLSELLKDCPFELEILNLGVPGYNSVQQVEFFKHVGRELSPDLVIIAYTTNDHFELGQGGSWEFQEFQKRFPTFFDSTLFLPISSWSLKHIHLLRLLYQALQNRKEPQDLVERHFGTGQTLREKVEATFSSLKRIQEEDGFKVFAVLFPHLDLPLNGQPYQLDDYHQTVHRAFKQLEFRSLDLLPEFVKQTGGNLRDLKGRCGGLHPDEKGHLLAARIIAESLKSTLGCRGSEMINHAHHN